LHFPCAPYPLKTAANTRPFSSLLKAFLSLFLICLPPQFKKKKTTNPTIIRITRAENRYPQSRSLRLAPPLFHLHALRGKKKDRLARTKDLKTTALLPLSPTTGRPHHLCFCILQHIPSCPKSQLVVVVFFFLGSIMASFFQSIYDWLLRLFWFEFPFLFFFSFAPFSLKSSCHHISKRSMLFKLVIAIHYL
jgi:hypothetical protein